MSTMVSIKAKRKGADAKKEGRKALKETHRLRLASTFAAAIIHLESLLRQLGYHTPGLLNPTYCPPKYRLPWIAIWKIARVIETFYGVSEMVRATSFLPLLPLYFLFLFPLS